MLSSLTFRTSVKFETAAELRAYGNAAARIESCFEARRLSHNNIPIVHGMSYPDEAKLTQQFQTLNKRLQSSESFSQELNDLS